MTAPRIALHPRKAEVTRGRRPRDGYGEKRAKREAARAPLLAQLPDFIPDAQTFEEREAARLEEWVRSTRADTAERWLRVLRWRRTASPSMRARFIEHWAKLPHSPEYALDLIHRLRHEL